MKHTLLIRPEGEHDIAEAHRWYENQRPGLGSDFVLCVEDGLAKIQRAPEKYAVVHRNIRRLLIHRFPYRIFYVVDQNSIVVLAVSHARRNPTQWKSRT
jgi:toxin ParE1/3/4